MHVVQIGHVVVVYPTVNTPHRYRDPAGAGSGGFSTSEAPDPHAVSALCTPSTSSLSRQVLRVNHRPQRPREPCLRAGRDAVCLPLLADPGGSPVTVGVPPCGSVFVGVA